MKRLMYCSISVMCLSIAATLFANPRNSPAFAQVPCPYETVFFDSQGGAFVYALRSDGVITRYGLSDGSVYVEPNSAPPGHYISLVRYEPNPYINGLFALRSDGEMFFQPWQGPDRSWRPFASLAMCQPIATSPSTLGEVKARFR